MAAMNKSTGWAGGRLWNRGLAVPQR